MVAPEEALRPGEAKALEQPESTASESKRGPGRFLTRKWLIVLLGGSIVGHTITFASCRWKTAVPDAETAEYALGHYTFQADPSDGGPVSSAEFALHVTLLDEVERVARQRLAGKKFRVRQAVEELIRRAHGGDFSDPSLGGLKRRLQEQINEALGVRVIADVMITDLRLVRNPHAVEKIYDTASSLPWTEEPAGLAQP